MQEFYINKGSKLPILRMELIDDGRHDFNKFYEAIQDANITFTMTNVDTGVIKIAKEPAYIQLRENDGCVEEYVICYNWRERDTKEKGAFKGEFNISFNGNISSPEVSYPIGNLIMPIREELIIYIL